MRARRICSCILKRIRMLLVRSTRRLSETKTSTYFITPHALFSLLVLRISNRSMWIVPLRLAISCSRRRQGIWVPVGSAWGRISGILRYLRRLECLKIARLSHRSLWAMRRGFLRLPRGMNPRFSKLFPDKAGTRTGCRLF